jgi:integrase
MRLYKRSGGGNWWVEFSHSGRQIRKSAGTTDRKAAQEYADRLKADLWRQTSLGDAPNISWDEAVLAWLADHGSLRALSDRKDHLRWFSMHLKGKSLATITRPVLEQLVRLRATEKAGNKHGKRPLQPATVNRYIATISAVLNYAHEREWIASVPRIGKLPEGDKRIRFLTQIEARRLLSKLPSHLAPMVEISLATGLRQANVTHLRWDQLDMRRRVAWIHPDQAKGRSAIAVPLSPAALTVLRKQLGKHEEWVFPYRGRPIIQPANTAWLDALEKSKLQNFRWHDLRHTWASWHVQNGTPLPVLMELGGWKDLKMVLRYAHLAPTHVAKYAGNANVKLRA